MDLNGSYRPIAAGQFFRICIHGTHLIVLCQRSIDIQLINVRQKSTVHNIEQPESDRLHFSGPGSDF